MAEGPSSDPTGSNNRPESEAGSGEPGLGWQLREVFPKCLVSAVSITTRAEKRVLMFGLAQTEDPYCGQGPLGRQASLLLVD